MEGGIFCVFNLHSLVYYQSGKKKKKSKISWFYCIEINLTTGRHCTNNQGGKCNQQNNRQSRLWGAVSVETPSKRGTGGSSEWALANSPSLMCSPLILLQTAVKRILAKGWAGTQRSPTLGWPSSPSSGCPRGTTGTVSWRCVQSLLLLLYRYGAAVFWQM